jgi:hypothetical protein
MYTHKNLGTSNLPRWAVVNALNQTVAVVPSGFGSLAEGVAEGIALSLNAQRRYILPFLPDTQPEELVRQMQVEYHEGKVLD